MNTIIEIVYKCIICKFRFTEKIGCDEKIPLNSYCPECGHEARKIKSNEPKKHVNQLKLL